MSEPISAEQHVSERYGSGGSYERSDDGDRPGSGSFESSRGGYQPDYSAYTDRSRYADGDDDRCDGHDPDIDAILHENDHLPEPRTRQQAARDDAASSPDGWGDYNPADYDQGDRNDWDDDGGEPDMWGDTYPDAGSAPRGDHRYFSTGNPDVPGSPDGPDGPGPHGPDGPGSHRPDGPDGPENTADQGAETDDALRQRVTTPEADNAELKAENTQLGNAVAEVKSENAELKSANTELHRRMSAIEARLERLEQKADDPALAAMRGSGQDTGAISAETAQHQPERPEWKSNEVIGLAAAVGGGVVTTAADYWSALPATYAGIAASALGIGAATIGWYRKHREVKDAHRPKH